MSRRSAPEVFGRSLIIRPEPGQYRPGQCDGAEEANWIQYFANEGAHETLVLEIPRGALYKPVFHRRTLQSAGRSGLALGSQFPWRWSGTPMSSRQQPKFRAAGALFSGERSVSRSRSPASSCFNRTGPCERRSIRGMENPRWLPSGATSLRYHQQTDVVLPDDSLSLIHRSRASPCRSWRLLEPQLYA